MAYAISAIAHWDWPEHWPGLFDILVSCLSGESEYAVHGAMRVLTEFTSDLTDIQLPNVGPVILQEMYRIFQSENVRLFISPCLGRLSNVHTSNRSNTLTMFVFRFLLAIFH